MDARVKDLESYKVSSTQDHADIRAEFVAADEAQAAALNEQISSAINTINANVGTLMENCLVKEDKTELLNTISAETTRATNAETSLDNRVHAIEIDYLKYADKAEVKNIANEANAAAISAKNSVDALLADASATADIVNTLVNKREF
jgi:hypothetical protein